MENIKNEERDIDALVSAVRQQLPEILITQWETTWPADDDNLWWFALLGVRPEVQVEGASCPFLIETDEQSSGQALKASTIQEAATMILNYLTAAKEGRSLHLEGLLWWA